MIPEFYQFSLSTKVLFQAGISGDFSNEISKLPVKKFFLICDPFFAENGTAERIQKTVQEGGGRLVGIYQEIPPNSELGVVRRSAEQAKKSGAEGIIAVGGGSSLDTAKAANILLSLGGDLVADYSGTQTLPGKLNPLIAIPTTAGTGSEVTSSAVILDKDSHAKLSFNDSYLCPDLALLDPELTLTLPPRQTAMTGMDALTHAIEAYTSLQANPVSDAMAMKAVKMISGYLLKAVKNGTDLEARSNMLVAANLAGIAFDHAMVGVVHAMSHATGGVAEVPHGMANSIYLPFGMEYNLETSATRYAGIARRFGIDTAGMDPTQAAAAAVAHVRKLRAQLKAACGLPETLREAGVKKEQLETIARLAVEDGTSFYNPREVVFEEVLQKIQEAYA